MLIPCAAKPPLFAQALIQNRPRYVVGVGAAKFLPHDHRILHRVKMANHLRCDFARCKRVSDSFAGKRLDHAARRLQ